MARILHSRWRGPGFDPWLGNWVPHAAIKRSVLQLKILHAAMKIEDRSEHEFDHMCNIEVPNLRGGEVRVCKTGNFDFRPVQFESAKCRCPVGLKTWNSGDFPGGPVVKTLPSNVCVEGFYS